MKILVISLLTLAQAQAVLIPYFYTGDFFTESTDPSQPLMSLSDRMEGSLLVDDSFWGTEVHQRQSELNAVLSIAGTPLGGIFDNPVSFTFSPIGEILFWSITIRQPGIDSSSGGFADGSGMDVIVNGLLGLDYINRASVTYPPGSPSRWKMEVTSVPDTGHTAMLLGLSVLGLFYLSKKSLKVKSRSV